MWDCWSFTRCFSWTLGSLSKCGQRKSYFSRCSSELAQLVPLPFSQRRSTCYCDRLHDLVPIPRCCKDVYVNSFFPWTSRLWHSLPIECFPLIYDLNGFESKINRHLLTVASFWRDDFNEDIKALEVLVMVVAVWFFCSYNLPL